jgi:hypothetical protein
MTSRSLRNECWSDTRTKKPSISSDQSAQFIARDIEKFSYVDAIIAVRAGLH